MCAAGAGAGTPAPRAPAPGPRRGAAARRPGAGRSIIDARTRELRAARLRRLRAACRAARDPAPPRRAAPRRAPRRLAAAARLCLCGAPAFRPSGLPERTHTTIRTTHLLRLRLRSAGSPVGARARGGRRAYAYASRHVLHRKKKTVSRTTLYDRVTSDRRVYSGSMLASVIIMWWRAMARYRTSHSHMRSHALSAWGYHMGLSVQNGQCWRVCKASRDEPDGQRQLE
jgi:hypothetical protein